MVDEILMFMPISKSRQASLMQWNMFKKKLEEWIQIQPKKGFIWTYLDIDFELRSKFAKLNVVRNAIRDQ